MIYVEVGIFVDTDDIDEAEKAVELALSKDKRIDLASTQWICTEGTESPHVFPVTRCSALWSD